LLKEKIITVVKMGTRTPHLQDMIFFLLPCPELPQKGLGVSVKGGLGYRCGT
jgi:hypothetical protein